MLLATNDDGSLRRHSYAPWTLKTPTTEIREANPSTRFKWGQIEAPPEALSELYIVVMYTGTSDPVWCREALASPQEMCNFV